MEVYGALHAAISDVVQSGSVTPNSRNAFFRAQEKSRFLFGDEIRSYLEQLRKEMVRHQLAEQQVKSEDDMKRAKAADVEAECFTRISNFYEEFPALIMPYVKMHQKAPPF